MLLFIDSDGDHRTGWEGYDFVVNKEVSSSSRTTVQALGGEKEQSAAGLRYAVAETRLELRVPRAALGLDKGSEITFDFHWADNIQKLGDVAEFSIHGDSAPDRRFNYRYR